MTNYLGIDGGGSSTRLLVVNQDNDVLYRACGGPSNVLVVGEERASHSLLDLMPEVPIHAVVAGLAGADRPHVRSFWLNLLNRFASQCWVVGDYRIAWAAATGGRSGITAIVGTGSIIYAEHKDKTRRMGGYGWRIGDAGSGIALGQAALKAVLAHIEGWGPQTGLEPAVKAWAGESTASGILDYVYRDSTEWRRVSDLARHVLALASADEVAHGIVRRQADELTRAIGAAADAVKLPASVSCSLTGGLAALWHPYLQPVILSTLDRDMTINEKEPVEGAVQLARNWYTTPEEAL